MVRTCHSVQSGACTKQPPCARCVWLSARAACARHITPCVRARCAFGSPPAHPLALLPATRKRRQHLGGQITPPAHGARRRARAGRSAPITTHTLGGSPLPARTGRCRARAGGRGRSRARGAHPRAHQKSSKITNFFQTNPTHTHQHHPTPPKNHHHPPKSPKNHPKIPPPPFFFNPTTGWTSRNTYVTAYQPLTSHEAAGRRSSNGREGAGKRVRPPGTEHPPRAILAVHEGDHLNHLVRRSSQLAELLLQLAKRVPPASFSTGLALGCVDSLRPQGTQG